MTETPINAGSDAWEAYRPYVSSVNLAWLDVRHCHRNAVVLKERLSGYPEGNGYAPHPHEY